MADYNLGPYRPRPRGEFVSSENYRYLDIVTYNGGSYICINLDTIDGIAVAGVLPTGSVESELYWQALAEKGEKGDMADGYNSFITVSNGVWDFNNSDKIIIPENAPDTLEISNAYNGCCGVILTTKDLTLPSNSNYSIDYNYISCMTNQYYMYTFVYGSHIGDSDKFIWNRTVIDQ